MKDDVLRVRSLHALQRLLAPLVALRMSRVRRAKAAAGKRTLPSVDVLKASPLFSKWPTAALQSWLESGKVEWYEKGTTIAFAGEPRRAADAFWLLSGKLVQVPSKAELRACAVGLVHLPRDQPKTGPLVLPSHFMDGNAKRSLPPLTAAQEQLADSLSFYHAGQLVDVERLLLGGERLRGLRCQGAVVVLRLAVAACVREMQLLPSVAYGATITAAREYVQRTMAQFVGAPSTASIMSANPVLAALPLAVLKSVRMQLKPFVFLKAEVICDNVFAAEWVYVLTTGQVRIDDSTGGRSHVVSAMFTAVGTNAFVQSTMPERFDQVSRATAAVYSEMWGMPVAALFAMCDAAARLPCMAAAAQLLHAQGTGRLPIAAALRAYPCFSTLSETAVAAISRALQLRLYAAGDTIASAGRIPSSGVLVLVGEVRLHRGPERDQKRLPPGQALFFCEALAKMCVSDGVVSHSSSLVLHGTPALLFEALEAAGTAAEDTDPLLRTAQDFVDRQYGAGLSEISRAQHAAAERVKDYRRRQGEEQQRRGPNAQLKTSPGVSVEVMENELLASLAVQLDALHPKDADAATFEYLRMGKTTNATPAVATTAAVVRGEALDTAPPPSRRSAEFFSLDDAGNLITVSGTAAEPPRGPAEVAVPPRVSSVVLPPSPPPPPSLLQQHAASQKATPRSAPTVLRTSVRPPPAAAKSSQKHPSPRVAALRAAASQVKDEADGVDRRRSGRGTQAHSTSR